MQVQDINRKIDAVIARLDMGTSAAAAAAAKDEDYDQGHESRSASPTSSEVGSSEQPLPATNCGTVSTSGVSIARSSGHKRSFEEAAQEAPSR